MPAGNSVKLFISYSHKDEEYREQLLIFMAPLINSERISDWSDHKILPGETWDDSIKEAFRKAEIIILLISSDFLASEYINKHELPGAILKHRNKEACVIPIFVRPAFLKYSQEITKLEGLPRNKRCISTLEDKDSAYLEIVEGIDEVVKKLTDSVNSTYQNIEDFKDQIKQKKVDDLSEKRNIYLAITNEQLEKKRDLIYYSLFGRQATGRWAYKVVPEPEEAKRIKQLSLDDQEAIVQEYIDKSIYSIHLIDNALEDKSSLISVQFEKAKRKCSGSLFKCIVGLNRSNIENELHKDIEEAKNSNPNIIKITDWNSDNVIDSLNNLILENEVKIEQLKLDLSQTKSVFLYYDTSYIDNPIKVRIKRLLEGEYGLIVKEPVPNNYNEEGFNRREFEENELRSSDGVVLLYRSTNKGWWITRQAAVLREKKMKTKNVRVVCIAESVRQEAIQNDINENLFTIIKDEDNLDIALRNFVSNL